MNQSSEISSKLWEEREDALRQDIREMLELELNRQKKRDRATEERHKKLQYYYRNKRTIYEQSLKELNDRKEAIRMIKKQIVLQQNMMHRLVFKVTLGGDDITELLYSTKETSIGVQGSETLQSEGCQSYTGLGVSETHADPEPEKPISHSVMPEHKGRPDGENDWHARQSWVLPSAGTNSRPATRISPCKSNMHKVCGLLGGYSNWTIGPLLTSSAGRHESMDSKINNFTVAIIKTIMLEITNVFLNSNDDGLERLQEDKKIKHDELPTNQGTLESSTQAEQKCAPSGCGPASRSSEELRTFSSLSISPKSKGIESVNNNIFGKHTTAYSDAKMIPRIGESLADSFPPLVPHTENTHPGIWQPNSKLDSLALQLIESTFEKLMVLNDGHESIIAQTVQAGSREVVSDENVILDNLQTVLNRENESSTSSCKEHRVESELVCSDLHHFSSKKSTVNITHTEAYKRNQQHVLYVSVEDFQDKLDRDKPSKSSVSKGMSGSSTRFKLPPVRPEKTTETLPVTSTILSHVKHYQDDLTRQKDLLKDLKTKPNYRSSISPTFIKNTKHIEAPVFQKRKTFFPSSADQHVAHILKTERTGSPSESDALHVHQLPVLLAGLKEKFQTVQCRKDVCIQQLRTQICPCVPIVFGSLRRSRDLVESVCRIIHQLALSLTCTSFQKVDETEAADMNSSDVGQIKFSQSCIPFTSIAEDIVEMVFDKLVEILQNDQPLIQDVHSAASDGMLNELCENLTSETIIQDLIDSVIFKLKDCIKMDFCLSYDG
ncbi:uncharacterized protein LOC143525115 isoform X2 [Brachyhypopomus gauderio]|uniref:uncharacterized protein LOC143525115 isoform X2 n=1 Tax=Brachyhypopomus gauderio TaxID=698409 RepID=UPI0040426E0E